jgi:hypothetical protein
MTAGPGSAPSAMAGITIESPLRAFATPLACDMMRKGRLVLTALVFSRIVSDDRECFFL